MYIWGMDIIINGVCSSNVVEALKAGGINLEETWTIQDFFDNPLETIDKMIPHPSNLSENPQLEKIGEFGSDVEQIQIYFIYILYDKPVPSDMVCNRFFGKKIFIKQRHGNDIIYLLYDDNPI